jgi:dolichyl-phosphate-mannose-protein mannosyltransferase
MAIPLVLSAFTHLWNPLGFLNPESDESTYIRRAMHVVVGLGPQESASSYDHPYFGQLFLAGIFKLIGYPESLHPVANGDVHSIEMLWLVPRVLMGLLAVVDTFLIYMICAKQYNRNTGLMASILFAVMPITWTIRRTWLEPIQLPFLLSSILFAVYFSNHGLNTRTQHNNNNNNNNKKTQNKNDNYNKQILTILLSGTFLGVAIFTKIPAFTMIPLVGYLIFKNSNRSFKLLGLWFIPVILIPAIWPAYALSHGQFGDWINGVLYQASGKFSRSLFEAIKVIFHIDPVLLSLGAAGFVFAVIKKDFFPFLWAVPFLIFLYSIGFVSDFHLIPLIPIFCIAAAALIVDLSNKIRYKNVQRILPLVIVAVVGIFGLINTAIVITKNITQPYFEAGAFLSKYLFQHKDNRITVIADPFYLWIPQYVFHLDHDYKTYYDNTPIKSDKVLLIVDRTFKRIMLNKEAGGYLTNIYNLFGTNKIETIDGVAITLGNLTHGSVGENLIDKKYIWRVTDVGKIFHRDNNSLNFIVTTNSTDKIYNRAILQTELNSTQNRPLLLSLDYSSQSIDGKAIFYAEIVNRQHSSGRSSKIMENNGILWAISLKNTMSKMRSESFVLPTSVANRPIEFKFYIITDGPGTYALNVDRAKIT